VSFGIMYEIHYQTDDAKEEEKKQDFDFGERNL
jgi:hypothetical protein